jgi:hypothetical protein
MMNFLRSLAILAVLCGGAAAQNQQAPIGPSGGGSGGGSAAPCSAFGTAAGTCAQGGVITAGGPTGSATVAPIITYNAAGQLTTVGSATITPAVGSITGLGSGVATALGNTAGGAGGFALVSAANVASVSNSDGTLTISPTTGAVVASINLAQANTWTAKQTISGAAFVLSGNISSAAWTTAGVRYANVAGTLTDTTSSGTVAAAYTDVFGGNTIAASSAVTFTNYISLYVKSPVLGANVTFTNNYALGADSLYIGGPGVFQAAGATGSNSEILFTVTTTASGQQLFALRNDTAAGILQFLVNGTTAAGTNLNNQPNSGQISVAGTGLYIGTKTSGQPVVLFAGGTATATNAAMSINGTGQVVTVGSATPATGQRGDFAQIKETDAAAAPGAGYATLKWVAGTNAGSCKLISYAGTSATPVTVVDNVGASC